MRCNPVVVCSVAALTVIASAQAVSAQNRPAAPAAAPPATTAAAPAVAETADRLIKEMSAYIGSANEFTFHADITFDHVLPSGQKLQFSSTEEVVMKRPDGRYVARSVVLAERSSSRNDRAGTAASVASSNSTARPTNVG